MKLKYYLLFLLGMPVLTVCGQDTGIFRDLTWEQAAVSAQREGKIVLVDVMMKPRDEQAAKQKAEAEHDLFKIPEVAEFCRQHVIAIRIDMGTEAGKAFAPKLVMNMYPTYGFFMPNGDILEVVNPYLLMQKPELFVEKGEKAWQAAAVKNKNSRSIVFAEMTLEEAMKEAKKENKPVFIDAYTSWCQPCVLMAKNVFTLDQVADFYNAHFINLKMDFGKEKSLAEKFEVAGYPAFLFISGDGKLIYKAGGYTEGEAFVNYAKEALKLFTGLQ